MVWTGAFNSERLRVSASLPYVALNKGYYASEEGRKSSNANARISCTRMVCYNCTTCSDYYFNKLPFTKVHGI